MGEVVETKFSPQTPQRSASLEKMLYHAVKQNDLMQVMGLLEKTDIDPNWVNKEENGQTALHVAAKQNNHVMVALLLGRGADVWPRDKDFRSPLNVALGDSEQDEKLLELLANKAVSSLEESKKQLEERKTNPNRNESSQVTPSKQRSPKSEQQQALLLSSASSSSSTSIPSSAPLSPSLRSRRVERRNEKLQRQLLDAAPQQSQQPQQQQSQQTQNEGSTKSRKKTKIQGVVKNSPFHSHFPRISLMSEMMRVSHFQTIWNIFVAVLGITFAHTLAQNYVEHGMLLDLSFGYWCFGGFQLALGLWCCMFCFTFSIYFIQKLVAKDILSYSGAFLFYFLFQAALIGGASWAQVTFVFPPATAIFLLCEMSRLSMKMHSYFMINRQIHLCKKNGLLLNNPSVAGYPNNVGMRKFFYFLWAPTLVFQTDYPRTDRINWKSVVALLVEFLFAVFYVYSVIIHSCVPQFNEMHGSYRSLITGIFRLMIPGTIVALLAFYGMLHCFQNAFAELTRFADRQFYSDWWNATSWANQYREHNKTLHNFLHRHVFLELRQTLGWPKRVSTFMTLFIATIVHEFVICMALGVHQPVTMIISVVPMLLLLSATKFLRGWRFWNIFMWMLLFIGNGTMAGLYLRAWYFAHHFPTQ